jgi:hypothetical protein
MAPLKNQKHENFCRLTLEGARFGWTQGEIYQRAGYKARGHSAEVLGSQLLKNIEVQRRIAELSEPAVKKAAITAESLIADFDRIMEGAAGDKQWSSVNRAVELRAKLKGYLIDRVEVGGPGSFFSACESVADIVRLSLLKTWSHPETLANYAGST